MAMTAQRKQMLALLVLCCALAVHGEAGARDIYSCTNGVRAMDLYLRYEGCPGPYHFERIQGIVRTLVNNLTLHNLNQVFTNYCSSAFPSLQSCFEDNIGRCSSAQQTSLRSIVQQTGFVCEPNTSRVHPVINHLLERLSDADLMPNVSCQYSHNETLEKFCNKRSFAAIGVNNTDNSFDELSSLTMEQLAPKMQTLMRGLVECTVSEVKRNLNSCSQWRGRALQSTLKHFLPTFLGNKNNFTNDQIDVMFHWSRQDNKNDLHVDLIFDVLDILQQLFLPC